ncbi:MAG TPA: non-homologous end-joining DNA ligase [Acidimicrobiales bacterium]|nr:non-homologous end-joining DNA ligase [Acidimicrobiales bacterium]
MSAVEVLDDAARRRLRREEGPAWRSPMLATLTHDPFDDPDWLYERKLDGERVLAVCRDGRVRLLSRNQKDLGTGYPEVVEALAAQAPAAAVLDGEVVAFEGGRTSFSRLQGRMQLRDPEAARRSGIEVFYYIFDLVHLEGWDTTGLPARDRKTLLREAMSFEDPLRFLPHRNREGLAYLREACDKGWEGLIAKAAAAPYAHGRSRDWRKFKCVNRQELVIGGYTEPRGSRQRFGALLVGYHQGGALVYAGKVGTGYDEETLASLGDQLAAREQATPPFQAAGAIREAGVHWVTPDLVGKFGFTEWTHDGRLRHPRYLGLRRDKDPTEVVREAPG